MSAQTGDGVFLSVVAYTDQEPHLVALKVIEPGAEGLTVSMDSAAAVDKLIDRLLKARMIAFGLQASAVPLGSRHYGAG